MDLDKIIDEQIEMLGNYIMALSVILIAKGITTNEEITQTYNKISEKMQKDIAEKLELIQKQR